MSDNRPPLLRLAPALLALGLLGGCNSGEDITTTVGGDNGAALPPDQVAGLRMPAKLSIVTAQSDTAAVAGVLNPPRVVSLAERLGVRLNRQGIAQVIDTTTFPVDADYNSDAVMAYNNVYDPSMEPLNTVNMILCLMDQTRAEEMVNQGPYIALVNEMKCETSSGSQQSSTNQGGVSNTQTVRYNKWTILSERRNNTSSQKVSIWVPGKPVDPLKPDPMDAQAILIEVEIFEGMSAAKPFGDFVLNFLGVVPDAGIFNPALSGQTAYTMVGSLRTLENLNGAPQFDYINLVGDVVDPTIASGFSRIEKTNVVKTDATGEVGIAKTYIMESMVDEWGYSQSRSAIYNIAFNPQYYLRGKTDLGPLAPPPSEACTLRDSFNTMVWNYNLYHETALTDFNGNGPVTAGQRVRLNSGFPFSYATQDALGNPVQGQGHVGYWGIWTEYGDSLADGTVITSQDFLTSGQDYRINLSDGKMWQRSAVQAPLTDLAGQTFTWYYWDPISNIGSDYAVRYNATAADMEAYATVTWDLYGPVETPLATPFTLSSVMMAGEQAWFWSDALGGDVVYSTDPLSGLPNPNVTFYKHGQLSLAELNTTNYVDYDPVTGTLPLICYEFCPKGGITGTPALESDLFYPAPWDAGFAGPYSYTLQQANGSLQLLDNNAAAPAPVTIPLGTDLSQIQDAMGNPIDWYQWGINSGQMVQVSNDPGINNWWVIYDLPNGFNWETGPNDWNRQTTVTRIADGQLVNFDEPVQFQYGYQAGDDPNINPLLTSHPAGNTFMLEYGGDGQLWGFPEGPEPGCDPVVDMYCRWVPKLTLADGVRLSTTLQDGNTYNFVVRAMEKEQYMRDANADPVLSLATCTGAGLDLAPAKLLELPYTTSSMVSLTMAGKPVVTNPPAVIEGVLQ